MFSALRIFVVIGVIFYFSPVRNDDSIPGDIEPIAEWGKAKAAPEGASSLTDGAARLETLWRALPDSAKEALVERLVASSSRAQAASPPEARLPSPSDTLQPEDLQPRWRGETKETKKPRL
jgi:hypothetical protein